ncbi:hypothetical protein [Brevibacillus gelatini]
MKKVLLVCMMFLLMLTSACGNMETTQNPITSHEPETETDETIIPPENRSRCFNAETINLDSETEKFFYGTWKVEKHLGFANSWNDASEYPTGQKFIGDELIVKKDFFSSKGLKNYKKYQYELKNPIYEITAICYNATAFYRLSTLHNSIFEKKTTDLYGLWLVSMS